MSKKKIIIIAAIIIFVLFAIGGSNSNNSSTTAPTQPQTAESQPSTAQQETKQEAQPVTKPEYLEAFHEVNARVENFEVVVKPGADGKAVATYIKSTCKQPCNIYVYDDAKAQKLDREYSTIGDNGNMDGKAIITETEAWQKKNYVYVADHLVGSIDFETGEYNTYPYRDSRYRELGGTQAN